MDMIIRKGKILVLFLCFVLLLPTVVAHAEETTVIGTSATYEAQGGKTVEIGVYINSKEKIASGSLELLYDKSLLSVKDVKLGESLSSYLTSVNGEKEGKISLAWANADGKGLDGTLLTVSVRLSKDNENIKLDLENVQLFNEDGSKVAVQLFDGEIKPFSGELKKHTSKVKHDKQWTITLNQAFNPATVNRHTVKVKDRHGDLIDVLVKKRDNTSFVIIPKGDYASGEYTLVISDQIRSSNGKKLKTPIELEFTVE